MRLLIVILVSVFGALLSAVSAHAENVNSNIFKADLLDPNLMQLVSSFEKICMPFILHKSELTFGNNRAHHQKNLSGEGFKLHSSELVSNNYLVEPRREPVCEPISEGSNYYRYKNPSVVRGSRVRGSIYNLQHLPEGIHYHSPKEIYGPVQIPPKFKTVTAPVETYIFEDDVRLTTKIGWNLPYINSPGKTCEIILKKPTISKTSFIDSFIEKDADWELKDRIWTQCVKDSDGEFLFELKHDPENLSIHVKRSDILEPNLCVQ